MELSPSPSPSEDSSDEDGRIEGGRGPLDHLPDVGETALGASVSSPSFLGEEEMVPRGRQSLILSARPWRLRGFSRVALSGAA